MNPVHEAAHDTRPHQPRNDGPNSLALTAAGFAIRAGVRPDQTDKGFADGALLSRQQTEMEIVKVGFEQFVAGAARDYGLIYGLATALMAWLTGWFASVVFRRD